MSGWRKRQIQEKQMKEEQDRGEFAPCPPFNDLTSLKHKQTVGPIENAMREQRIQDGDLMNVMRQEVIERSGWVPSFEEALEWQRRQQARAENIQRAVDRVTPPVGDIRALKHRIHELEGELMGYKKILDEQSLREPDAVATLTEEGWTWDGDQWQRPPQQDCVGWFGYDTGLRAWFETNKGDDDSIPLYKESSRRTWYGLMRGVRVEGDTVVITVKGGNNAARKLCGALIEEMNK